MIFKEIITTLFEKEYHFGVGALINSLVKSGFKDLLIIGYKGNLPTWINQLQKVDNLYYKFNDIFILFQCLDTEIHLGYYKPFFLADIFTRYSEVENIFYFDPDIVINAPWTFFSKWTKNKISLCLDVCFPFVSYNHPWRIDWLELAPMNSESETKINYYVNSGFIGISRNYFKIVEKWKELTTNFKKNGGDVKSFHQEQLWMPIRGDQELLNASITLNADLPYCVIGTEGMGFTLPDYIMSHAIGSIKPWNKSYTIYLITKGKKPSTPEKRYFENSMSYLKLYSKLKYGLKKCDIKTASFLGRFLTS